MEILFSHIYIYLYIICENDTSKSYFHIYTFSFLEEFHPSFTSFHTQEAPVQGGQRVHGAGEPSSPAAECTAGLEKLWKPGTGFPVVCIYRAADSAWGQLANLVVCM